MVVKPALCRYKFLVHTSFPQTTATLCALNKKKKEKDKKVGGMHQPCAINTVYH